MQRQCVIVGGGQAGAWAATTMRKAGFSGRIVLVGDEPDLPYERPPLSKAVLRDPALYTSTPVLSPDRWAADAIELRLGVRVEDIDVARARVRLDDGQWLAYDALVLATGGTPRRLGFNGSEHVRYLRTIADARTLRERLEPACRVVCIGAGVVSLEIASSARALGCEVSIIEIAPRVMQRAVTPEVSARFAELHTQNGVALHLGTAPGCIAPATDGFQIACMGREPISADLVVAGIGMVRNDGLAENAGIEADNGIIVDPWGRTNIENIFAAGEVTAFWHEEYERRLRLESWKHAQDHGIAVGQAIATGCQSAPYTPIPWFWSEQHGRMLQVAGLPIEAETTIEREIGTSYAAFHFSAQGTLSGVSTIDDPRLNRAAQAVMARKGLVDSHALSDPARDPLTVLKAAVKDAARQSAS